MAKVRLTKFESTNVLIEIATFEQTYHIADYRTEIGRVDDEASIEVCGTVVRSNSLRWSLDGKSEKAALTCSQSCPVGNEQPETELPMLMQAELAEGVLRLLAYLPPWPFWTLPNIILSGRTTHMIVDYRVLPRGRSKLESLYFASKTDVERRAFDW